MPRCPPTCLASSIVSAQHSLEVGLVLSHLPSKLPHISSSKTEKYSSMQNWLDNPVQGAAVGGSLSKRGETEKMTQGWCPALPGIICHSTREHRPQPQTWQIQVFGREDQNLEFLKKGKKEKKRHCFDNLEKWCDKIQWGSVQGSTIRQE